MSEDHHPLKDPELYLQDSLKLLHVGAMRHAEQWLHEQLAVHGVERSELVGILGAHISGSKAGEDWRDGAIQKLSAALDGDVDTAETFFVLASIDWIAEGLASNLRAQRLVMYQGDQRSELGKLSDLLQNQQKLLAEAVANQGQCSPLIARIAVDSYLQNVRQYLGMDKGIQIT